MPSSPSQQLRALLNRNIVANRLETQVIAFCAAISDHSGFGVLHLSQFMAGGSCHSLDEKLDAYHRPFRPVSTQGCVSDYRRSRRGGQGCHRHITSRSTSTASGKVIHGAARTIGSATVRSLLIEVNQNLPGHLEMVRELVALGFASTPIRFGAPSAPAAASRDARNTCSRVERRAPHADHAMLDNLIRSLLSTWRSSRRGRSLFTPLEGPVDG